MKRLSLFFACLLGCFGLVYAAPPSDMPPVSGPLYDAWKLDYITNHSPRPPVIQDATTVAISNAYLDARLNSSAAMTEGGNMTGSFSYQRIFYGYPSVPSTSWMIFKVDGLNAYHSRVPPVTPDVALPGGVESHVGDTLRVYWADLGGFSITEDIWLESLGGVPGEIEVAHLRVTAHNNDPTNVHLFGWVMMIDTDVLNDAAPISTSFGYDANANRFYAPMLPSIWRAYQSNIYPPPPATMQALGILTGFQAVTPDMFWYGQWGNAYGANWNTSETQPVGAPITDSAVLMKWFQRPVAPNGDLVLATYVGIGVLPTMGINLTHTPPTINDSLCNYSPNPFTLSALISNTGTGTANNVVGQLFLPPGLTLVGGTANPYITASLPGFGATVVANWNVQIDDPSIVTSYDYVIQVTSSSVTDTIRDTFRLDLPPHIRAFPMRADLVWPRNHSWVTCPCQTLEFSLYDPALANGAHVLLSTIHLTVDGTRYNYPNGFRPYNPATGQLIWDPALASPPACFASHEVVWTLDTITSTNICTSPSPLTSGDFHADLLGPLCGNIDPPSGDTLRSPIPNFIHIDLDDSNRVDPSGIAIQVTIRQNGVRYDTTYVSPDVSIVVRRGYIEIEPRYMSFGNYQNGDTITICLQGALDDATTSTCPPNMLQSQCCATYYTSFCSHNTWATAVRPTPPGQVTSCPNQDVRWAVQDTGAYQLDSTNTEIAVYVNGGAPTTYQITSPDLTWLLGDTVHFTPTTPFANEDRVRVCLTHAMNEMGCDLAEPVCDSFIMDLEAPMATAGGIFPAPGAVISDPTPTITVRLADNLTLGDTTRGIWSLAIRRGGSTLNRADTGGSYLGNFQDQDSVRVCYRAPDRPNYAGPDRAGSYCNANWMTDTCWNFVVSLAGPSVRVIRPRDRATTACADQQIAVLLTDLDGLDASTIRLQVDGTTYSISPPQLRLVGDTLLFTPSSPWPHGYVVNVSLLAAADRLGNNIPAPTTWFFTIDLQGPRLFNVLPLPNSVISDPQPILSGSLVDTLSGVMVGSLILQINGITRVPVTNTTLVGGIPVTTLSWDPGAYGVTFDNDEMVQICIHVTDSVSYCDPNALDTCWHFTVHTAPPAMMIVTPTSGQITSCLDQSVCILATDAYGVDPANLMMLLDNDTVRTATQDGDTLCFSAPRAFNPQDTVRVQLIHLADTLGNDLTAPISWTFYVDRVPPTITAISPRPDTTVEINQPVITIQLTDRPAGVRGDTMDISIDGTWYTLSSPATSYNAGTGVYTFDPALISLSLPGGSTSRICFRAWDDPDLCPRNRVDSCWNLSVASGGPSVTLLNPPDSAFSACSLQTVVLLLRDPQGVDRTSIRLEVGGTTYAVGASLTFVSDTLRFTPSTPWTDGTTVVIRLVACADQLGNPFTGRDTWSWRVDLSPPVLSNLTPAPGSTIGTRSPLISFDSHDAISGLGPVGTSLNLRFGGNTYALGHAAVRWLPDSGRFTFDPTVIDTLFSGGEIITICAHAQDAATLCGPNAIDTCWSFSIEAGGPAATLLHPPEGSWSACDRDTIRILLTDENGIDFATIRLEVGGVTYPWGDPTISMRGDTLVWTAPDPWLVSGRVTITLTAANDSLGNPLAGSATWTYNVDRDPPVITGIVPAPGTEVADGQPDVTLNIDEYGSDLNMATFSFTVDGNPIPFGPALTFIGSTLTFVPESLLLTWPGGSMIHYCLHVADQTTLCGPNTADTCWDILIQSGGPMVRHVLPPDNSFNSCDTIRIQLTLTDPQGVDPSSIRFEVNAATHDLTMPEMTWTDDTLLTFTPATPWADGTTVTFRISAASDVLGNPYEATARTWSFVVDRTPPAITLQDPAPGDVVSTRYPPVRITLVDPTPGAGLDPSSVVITLNPGGFSIPGTSGIVAPDGSIVIDTDSLGATWRGGDVVTVCVQAEDLITPGFCPPNLLDSCWTFSIAASGPVPVVLEPLAGSISSCPWQPVVIRVSDPDGIDWNHITLVLGTDTIRAGDPRLTFFGPDSLVFIPATDWVHGTVVTAILLSAWDSLGNDLGTGPLTWSFTLDLAAPGLSDPQPTGRYTWDALPPFSQAVADGPLAVRVGSFVVETRAVFGQADPLTVTWPSPALAWDGTRLTFTPTLLPNTNPGGVGLPATGGYYPERAFAEFRIALVEDSGAAYCGPNVANGAWHQVWIPDDDSLPPTFANEAPDSVPVGDSLSVSVEITDPSGIWAPSVILWYSFGSPAGVHSSDSVAMDLVGSGPGYITSTRLLAPGDSSLMYCIVCATDDDWDFGRDADRAGACDTFTVRIQAGPSGLVVAPQLDEVTSCADQEIRIRLISTFGVDPRTLRLKVAGTEYTIDDAPLRFAADTIIFHPPADFTDGQQVEVELLAADDLAGNPLFNPGDLHWSFWVDLTAPVAVLEAPDSSSIVIAPDQAIRIHATDNLSGVDPNTVVLNINDIDYSVGTGVIWNAETGMLTFIPSQVNRAFERGDTVRIRLSVGDSPDYCAPNTSLWSWFYLIEPRVVCAIRPNVFSPNNDGINEQVVFDYPNLLTAGAHIGIYNLRNTLVWETDVQAANGLNDISTGRTWNGLDNKGQPLAPGVYLYVIKVNGQSACSGTVTLVR